jgi:hypothetical protein
MAYRSGSVTSFTTGAQNTTTFSINSPVGVQQNDIIIIGGASDANGGQTWSSTGFTSGDQLSQTTSISQGPHATMGWLWKVAGASEPGSYTVTLSAGLFTDCEAFCAAWTGRNTTSPITANSQTKTAGGGTPHTFALTGVTSAAGDDVICFVIAQQNATCAWTAPTNPSGMATLIALQSATPFGNAYAAYVNAVSAGATGTVNPVETGVGTDNIGFVFSLAQGSTGPPPVSPQGPMPRQIYIMP